MKVNKFTWLLAILFCGSKSYSQTSNTNPNKGPVNVALPKTPESQGFEKYGNYNVSELTGTPDISIPIYTVKSRFLQVPITLSYQPSGIKVNQEASWVGLGWDLNVGGRITVETRGAIDGDNRINTVIGSNQLKGGAQKIFNRLGVHNDKAVYTYSSSQRLTIGPVYYPGTFTLDPNWDDEEAMAAMSWYGLGEPDIYHASFMGNSVSFYFDMITGELKWLGEKSLFDISVERTGSIITSWKITDNNANKYYFERTEVTKTVIPPAAVNILTQYEATSAWLLTKIEHPTGDIITFTYENYGSMFPANSWNSSLSASSTDVGATPSYDFFQTTVEQYPQYLTKIETADSRVDFLLTTREDIKGAGSRKLNEIRIVEKQTNEIIRKIILDQGYFIGTPEGFHNSASAANKKYYTYRLKLNKLLFDETEQMPPYKFSYFNIRIPDKYTLQQDHWGFYNGAPGQALSNVESFSWDNDYLKKLIPKKADLIAEGILSESDLFNTYPSAIDGNWHSKPVVPTFLDGQAVSRRCNPYFLPTMTLESIVYPTGGSTKFIYEPHESVYKFPKTITGGGLRIKNISNYTASGLISGFTEYNYETGTYLGYFNYLTGSVKISSYTTFGQPTPLEIPITLSANGVVNYDDMLIAYPKITITQKSIQNQSGNGKLVKYFNVPAAYELNHNIDVRSPHHPQNICRLLSTNSSDPLPPGTPPPVSCVPATLSTDLLFFRWSGFAPTPRKDLDGKLMKEEYYNSANSLLKSTQFHYSQVDYSNDFYSIKTQDNFLGGFQAGIFAMPGVLNESFDILPFRRFSIYVSPAKSYFTHTDKVVETIYEGGISSTQEKSYLYNAYHQPQKEITKNSDGTETIVYTKTSLDMQPPHVATGSIGDAALLNRNNKVLPIEQLVMKKAGEITKVIGGRYNVYQNSLPVRSYKLETGTPLILATEFKEAYFTYPGYPGTLTGSGYDFAIDSKYKLEQTAVYNDSYLIKDFITTNNKTAYIWDEVYNNLTAQCVNASENDIAYSSFETTSKGNWSYSGVPVQDNTAITGTAVYTLSLSLGSIAKNELNPSLKYIVSYWSKNGQYNVTGSLSVFAGSSVNNWQYFEHTAVPSAVGDVILSGSGSIDELRIYPATSLMTSYTYKPLTGLSSQNDVNSKISYYEYDNLNRLILIRDQKKNILKKIEYQYNVGVTYPYTNTGQSVSFTRNNCMQGYETPYPITTEAPEGSFGSFISTLNANQNTLNYLNQNFGQAYANQVGTCIPYYRFIHSGSFRFPGFEYSLNGNGSVHFKLTMYKEGESQSAYGQIGTLSGSLFLPSAVRHVTVSGTYSCMLTFHPSGVVEIAGPELPSSVVLEGDYQL